MTSAQSPKPAKQRIRATIRAPRARNTSNDTPSNHATGAGGQDRRYPMCAVWIRHASASARVGTLRWLLRNHASERAAPRRRSGTPQEGSRGGGECDLYNGNHCLWRWRRLSKRRQRCGRPLRRARRRAPCVAMPWAATDHRGPRMEATKSLGPLHNMVSWLVAGRKRTC